MNKKTKHIIVGILGLHLIYIGGCANKTGEVSSPNVITETDNDATIQSSENLDNDAPEPKSNEKNENYIGNDLWIENLTDFSEGRAWVQFRESHREDGSVEAVIESAEIAMKEDEERIFYEMQNINWQGNERAALIDTQGKIIWESELTENNTVLTKASEFKNGLA